MITVEKLSKRYGDTTVVDEVSFSVERGSITAIVGTSGSGKSTLLRMINRLIEPSSGRVLLDGRDTREEPAHLLRRRIGYVIQGNGLFPHRTVAENIAFGLRMRKVPKAEIAQRVRDALAMVRLEGFGDRRPAQLSGGQKQRVALARALVIRPALLLLDEPLSNLDLKLREEMRVEISGLQRRLGIATVFVTHDQDEALTMSDRIAVMRQGRIEQIGSAQTIYEHPATEFVATFIGTINRLRANVTARSADGIAVDTGAGPARLPADAPVDADTFVLTLRPERLKLAAPRGAPDGAVRWGATIERITYLGARLEMALRLADGTQAVAHLVNAGPSAWQPGEAVEAWFLPGDAWAVPVNPDP